MEDMSYLFSDSMGLNLVILEFSGIVIEKKVDIGPHFFSFILLFYFSFVFQRRMAFGL